MFRATLLSPSQYLEMLVLGTEKNYRYHQRWYGGACKVIEGRWKALHEGRSRMFQPDGLTRQHAVGSDCGGTMSVYIAVRCAPAS